MICKSLERRDKKIDKLNIQKKLNFFIVLIIKKKGRKEKDNEEIKVINSFKRDMYNILL